MIKEVGGKESEERKRKKRGCCEFVPIFNGTPEPAQPSFPTQAKAPIRWIGGNFIFFLPYTQKSIGQVWNQSQSRFCPDQKPSIRSLGL
jgi:hypothetical protein